MTDAGATVEAARPHSFRANTLALGISQASTWMFSFGTFALLPRYLGPSGLGQINTGVAFASIGVGLATLGMELLIAREVARDRGRAVQLLPSAIWLTLALGIACGAALFLVAAASGYGRTTLIVVGIACVSIPGLSLLDIGRGAVQGSERMRSQAVVDVTTKTLYLAMAVAIVLLDGGVIAVAVVSALMWTGAGVAMMRAVQRAIPYRLWMWRRDDTSYLVRRSLPFWAMSVSLVIYGYTNILILSWLVGEAAVGIYAAPHLIFTTMLFIPSILSTVTYPQMSASFERVRARWAELAQRGLFIVLSLIVPLAIMLIGLGADLLVLIVGSEFEPSRLVLMVMSVQLIPTSINMLHARVLMSANLERRWTFVLMSALPVRIALSVVLILLFDRWIGNAAVGAVASFIVVESAMAVVGFVLTPAGAFDRGTARFLALLALAGGIAGAAMVAGFETGIFGAAAVTGMITYLAAAALLRINTRADVEMAVRWVLSRQRPATNV